MGNSQSRSDLTNNTIITNDDLFKVDNINSYGRKHSSAKIQLLNDNLCIHQKHRQSLFIPLNTIKRYGLDGSIFILECGRRAPLGPARYAFRCKRANELVDCLDQRISFISSQLFEREHDKSSLSLTTVSSTIHPIRQVQSSISLSSSTSFYRESQPTLSENYFNFGKENDDYNNSVEIVYTEFKNDKHTSNGTLSNNEINANSNTTNGLRSYVFIDHEKTTTLKEIAEQRLQQYPQRSDV